MFDNLSGKAKAAMIQAAYGTGHIVVLGTKITLNELINLEVFDRESGEVNDFRTWFAERPEGGQKGGKRNGR